MKLPAVLPTRLALAATLVGSAGCASLRPLSRTDAQAAALRNVCGSPPRAAADSLCVVRTVERVRGGYRVILDRRPPAGQDRLALVVRRGGLFGGWAIDAAQMDTAARPARR